MTPFRGPLEHLDWVILSGCNCVFVASVTKILKIVFVGEESKFSGITYVMSAGSPGYHNDSMVRTMCGVSSGM